MIKLVIQSSVESGPILKKKFKLYKYAATWDFQHGRILTSVESIRRAYAASF